LRIYKEQVVANKTKMGVEQGLNIVLCIGENFMEKKEEMTFSVLQTTLDAVKSNS
jgi:triosephosphate isomerase